MKVKGIEITQAQIDACLVRMRMDRFYACQIYVTAIGAGVSEIAADRVADRLIQRERKAGRIELLPGNCWKWVTQTQVAA